jgi:CheY-like chemotaxis protein
MGVGMAMGRLTTADGRKPRVALVGGGQSATLVASMLVEQFGCSAVCAPTGNAVLGLLASQDRLDLVLIDLSAPGKDALVATALAGALRSRRGPPVVAIVGAAASGLGGYAGTVAKPYSPRELYAALSTALGLSAQAPLPTFA